MKRWAVVPLLALIGVLVALCRGPAEIPPITEDCVARRYVKEFTEPDGVPRAGLVAPDGNAEVFTTDGWFGPWHTVWLREGWMSWKRILRYREIDPGSGPSVDAYWSADGRAVWIHGAASATDPELVGRASSIRIIYSLDDGVAWYLGPD